MFSSLVSLIVPLALTATSWARPMLNLNVPRSTPGPWCDGLGPGAFDIAYNFTLAAYNNTWPNTNTTGLPLVLGQNGATTGAEFKVLSVRFNYLSLRYEKTNDPNRRMHRIRTTISLIFPSSTGVSFPTPLGLWPGAPIQLLGVHLDSW